jgi:hypothetical protein
VILFELSVQMAKIMERRSERRAESVWDDDDDPDVS